MLWFVSLSILYPLVSGVLVVGCVAHDGEARGAEGAEEAASSQSQAAHKRPFTKLQTALKAGVSEQ